MTAAAFGEGRLPRSA